MMASNRPLSGLSVGPPDRGSRPSAHRHPAERERQDGAAQPKLSAEFGRLNFDEFLTAKPQKRQFPAVALNDQDFADADLSVEGEFLLRIIAGTFDLDKK